MVDILIENDYHYRIELTQYRRFLPATFLQSTAEYLLRLNPLNVKFVPCKAASAWMPLFCEIKQGYEVTINK